MNAKSTIRKILFIAIWLCIGGGMLTLLLAAISKKNRGLCSNYVIRLLGDKQESFIDTRELESQLEKLAGGPVKGKAVATFNLNEMEIALERNNWVSDAELYFDNKDVLHVTITEKVPVARIFNVSGSSFYIDSLGRSMPLSETLSARVPVFTGFPNKKTLSTKDSILLNDIRTTANFINNNPFWMSQVAQIDILPDRSFEMIPVVGNHAVKLGTGSHMASKFRRLFVFYKQVLSKTGFDRYKQIDVQYAGQVVVTRQKDFNKVDSIQLRRNVEKLLRHAREAVDDTVARIVPKPVQPLVPDEPAIISPAVQEPKQETPDPNPMKTTSVSNLPVKPAEKAKKPVMREERQPKAVMPKQKTEEPVDKN